MSVITTIIVFSYSKIKAPRPVILNGAFNLQSQSLQPRNIFTNNAVYMLMLMFSGHLCVFI